MSVKEKAIEILKEDFVCDNCLGLQFGQLLTDMTNEERGKILRHYLAMLIDSKEKISIDNSNFYGIKFYNVKIKPKKPKKCSICGNLFQELKKKAKKIIKKLKKYEFETFLVGCKLPEEIAKNEQKIWEFVGIEWCESIKSEINRELGKEIEKITGKKMMRKLPDITILYDLTTDNIKLDVRSLFVYGKYQKLIRGIPQTKWKKKTYKSSVQEIIEKPFLKQTKAISSSFHGEGREDIDTRCLGWRPFVLELIEPKKRKLNLKESQKEINKSKKVRVKDLKLVEKRIIKHLKATAHDKVYRAEILFERKIENPEKLKTLDGTTITQKTPTRVLKRRSDLTRKRQVKNIKYRVLSKKKILVEITAQSGLYVKELITGDEGRTQPNISSLLNNKVKKIKLDVIKICG